MSNETILDLNSNTLIGYADKRGTAWHYREGILGVDENGVAITNHYPAAVPVEDVRARLFDWEVVTEPVFRADGKPFTDHKGKQRMAHYRSDTGAGLSVTSESWQNHGYSDWLLDGPAAILDADLAVGQAGLLRGGAVAWVSIEMADTIQGPAGIEIRPQILCTTSLDQTIPSTFKRTSTIVVCDNTWSAAMGEKGDSYRVKHTSKSVLGIADARTTLEIIHADSADFIAELDRLVNVKVSDAQWDAFLDVHKPLPEAQVTKGGGPGRGFTMAESYREGLTALAKHDARCAPWWGTAFGVVQTVNTYRQHLSQVKGAEGSGVARAERNMFDTITGADGKADDLALRQLMSVLA